MKLLTYEEKNIVTIEFRSPNPVDKKKTSTALFNIHFVAR